MHRPKYMLDAYAKECESSVHELLDPTHVVLQDTIFYPQGGGQPFDTGMLIRAGEQFRVLSVRKQDGMVVHEVDRAGLQKHDKVTAVIDWDRRYRHMRMHTAAHILCAVFEQREDTKITGNQLGEKESRVDLDLDEFNREKMEECVKIANDIIARSLPIEVRFVRMDDAKKDPSLFKLAMEFPHQLEEIRLVDIVGHDVQADGGTHVKSTSEVGKIVLLRLENKGKSKRRVYFGLEP